ncbi:MAG: ATP-binding protein, partial [Egibacteraceae bacterium]
ADPPSIELHLPRDPAAVAAARHCVASLVCYAAEDLVDRVTLAVSELATNAVVHTGAAFRIRATCHAGHLLVEVDDLGSGVPHRRQPDELAQTGRGVGLIEAVADRCGTTLHEPGKTVWAAFDAIDAPVA